MGSALVIFNGIKFPYHLMEYSLDQARQRKLSLHALFLKAGKEVEEGYGYPSDMKAAAGEFDVDNEREDLGVINHLMKLTTDMAETEAVVCTNELKIDCSLEDISLLIKNYEIVYVDTAFDNENTSMLCNTKFALRDLIELAPAKIKTVDNN